MTETKTPILAPVYPAYYRQLPPVTHLDVYAVCKLFDVQDPSGALQHAIKKLLLSGVRTGGKSSQKDVCEARDTLDRWIEMNQ
jgi:hypothetical protein